MALITYKDKVSLVENPDIADENKVTAQDMNEIKKVVNENQSLTYDSLPVGTILPYSSSTVPIGYLLCDGSLISRTEYSGLFNVIGTSYNLETDTDDTKFRLPNLKGRVPVGLDSEDTDFNTLGKTGGEKEHKLTIDELPISSFKASGSSGDWTYVGVSSTKPHNNLPPYIVTNYIIKASGTAVLKGNVVNNLTDNSTENAPSQRAVNEALLDTYSTDEQRIGTWFGKPLYRKTIEFTISSTVDTWQQIDNISDVEKCIKHYGYIIVSTTEMFFIPDHTQNAPYFSVNRNNNTIRAAHTNSGISNKTCVMTFEYTKTTD